MHEFSLAQGILNIALESAASHQLGRLSAVHVDVGTAAGVNTDALAYAWEFLRTTEEVSATAELTITVVQAAGDCASCGFSGPPEGYLRLCPACGAGGFRLVRGTEFIVTGISGE